jgi:hypothetical protein
MLLQNRTYGEPRRITLNNKMHIEIMHKQTRGCGDQLFQTGKKPCLGVHPRLILLKQFCQGKSNISKVINK